MNRNETSIKRSRVDSRIYGPLLSDIVTLLPSYFTSLLPPEDVLSLLTYCSPSLPQGVCDVVATQGLKTSYDREKEYCSEGCMCDWFRLVPLKRPLGCSHDHNNISNDSSIPRLRSDLRQLLEAMCFVHKGIRPHCFCVLQLDRSFERRQYGVLQPVLFPLTTTLQEQVTYAEDRRESSERINAPDVATLIYVLKSLGTDCGTRFFRSSDPQCKPAGMVEAHWKEIHVDVASGTTRCQFCDFNTYSMIEGPLNPQLCKVEYEFLMRQHCRDVYQPLKMFMTLHLQHVRYVRFPRRLSKANDSAQGNEWIKVIAGFTSGGILCGAFLADTHLPRVWATDRLAPGAYPFDESAIDRTRLRIAY